MKGSFFHKKIVISNHAKIRYAERIGGKTEGNRITKKGLNDGVIRKAILDDLSCRNVQRKSPKEDDNTFKVWCRGSKEYVCLETEKTIKVLTFISKKLDDKGRY